MNHLIYSPVVTLNKDETFGRVEEVEGGWDRRSSSTEDTEVGREGRSGDMLLFQLLSDCVNSSF